MLNHHHVCKHILVENLSKLTYDLWCHGLSVCMWVYLCQRQHVKVYFFSYKKTVKSVDELAADPSLELPLWFSQASIIFSPRCTVPKTSDSSLPDEFLNPPCFTVAGNQQKPLKVKKLFLTFKLIADAKPPQNRLKTFGPIHQLIEHDTIQLSPQVGWDWE